MVKSDKRSSEKVAFFKIARLTILHHNRVHISNTDMTILIGRTPDVHHKRRLQIYPSIWITGLEVSGVRFADFTMIEYSN